MPISEGYITEPIGLKSLADYFGTARDVASVCKASGINKWSKRKPTGFEPDNPALPSTTHRNYEGYWWAVQLECRQPTKIHSFKFDYLKPGDDDLKRIEEFIGYSQGAQPNLAATLAVAERRMDIGMEFETFATFSKPEYNQYGIDYIDVFRLVQSMDGVEALKVFKNVYPICVVDDHLCVMGYAKSPTIEPGEDIGEVLPGQGEAGTGDSGKYTMYPLSDGEKWYLPFSISLEDLNQTIPSGLTVGNHTVTLGVIVKLGTNGPTYDGGWYKIKDSWNDKIFPLPFLTGMVFEFYNTGAPKAVLDITGISVNGVGYDVTFPNSDEDINVYVEVTITETTTKFSVTEKFSTNPSFDVVPARQISWKDLGYMGPAEGTLYEFKGKVRTSLDDKKWTIGTGDTWSGQYTGGGTIIG